MSVYFCDQMLDQLYTANPWKTVGKFFPIASKFGYSKAQVQQFLRDRVVHDKQRLNPRRYHLPIFGKQFGSYQFDTLVQSRGSSVPAFLVLININSRKGYAIPMSNKGSSEVLSALNHFFSVADVKPVAMTSDQDPAYLTEAVTNFFIEHEIDYRTTEDNNHNILGVINRFIRTLRDLNASRDFTVESMTKVIDAYNSTKHRSTGIAPNDFTEADNDAYVIKMLEQTEAVQSQNDFRLQPGDKVRIVLEKAVIGKKRANLSQDHYLVDSISGNGYLIKAADDSVGYYPRHRLVKNGDGKFAATLNNDKRGIVDHIKSYNPANDTYKVVYSEGTEDTIKAKNLRETQPTRLSRMEVEYWKHHKNIPASINRFRARV